MFLIDTLHARGIGVILDWVPAHFPTDAHGLALFDGTHLYEHADPRQGFHPEWNSSIFNYSRNEVRSFLLSSAHVLARPLPRRRPPRRRRIVDALPRLRPQARRVGAERPRRAREPRRRRLLARAQRRRLPRPPRRADDRGGVDVVAARLEAHGRRGPRLRPQVGHGLDARHARVLRASTRCSARTTRTS